MLKSLNCSLIGVKASPEEQVALADRFGFDAVDLHLMEIDNAAAVRDAMHERGIAPGCANGLLPVRTTATDEQWDAAMENLPRLLETAQTLGFERTMMVLMPFHETLSFEACMEQHVTRLTQAATLLASAGVRIGLEYVSPRTRRAGQPTVFLHDLAGCLQLLEAVGQPGLGLLLDSFHWYCAGETASDLSALAVGQIVAVHINDAVAGRPVEEQVAGERELPGATGIIDLDAFLGALQAIGYDGPVTCEPMWAPLQAMSADEAVQTVSRAVDDVLNAQQP